MDFSKSILINIYNYNTEKQKQYCFKGFDKISKVKQNIQQTQRIRAKDQLRDETTINQLIINNKLTEGDMFQLIVVRDITSGGK